MSLLHEDGGPVTFEEWLRLQGDLALTWRLREEEHLAADEALFCWAKLFAQYTREICDRFGVRVETFCERFVPFENRASVHIEVLKWLESERVQRNVGLDFVCRSVESRVEVFRGEQSAFVRFSLTFPRVSDHGEAHTESVDFPIPNTFT